MNKRLQAQEPPRCGTTIPQRAHAVPAATCRWLKRAGKGDEVRQAKEHVQGVFAATTPDQSSLPPFRPIHESTADPAMLLTGRKIIGPRDGRRRRPYQTLSCLTVKTPDLEKEGDGRGRGGLEKVAVQASRRGGSDRGIHQGAYLACQLSPGIIRRHQTAVNSSPAAG